MLCEKCSVNIATQHLINIISGTSTEFHFCSECAKEWKLNLQSISSFTTDPVETYRQQMLKYPLLNKNSFNATCRLSGDERLRELCYGSCRHIFELAERLHCNGLKIELLDFIQRCNASVLNAAKEFDGWSFEQWKSNIESRIMKIKDEHSLPT